MKIQALKKFKYIAGINTSLRMYKVRGEGILFLKCNPLIRSLVPNESIF
jgi:hypothetical protein